MDFVEIFPLEIVEKIFQHLPSKDILNCCLVSVRWREALNSNGIWSYLCQEDHYSEKEPLETKNSYFDNPRKRYQTIKNSSDRLSSLCSWRSHYNRYKYLESNWRRGKFTLHRYSISHMAWPWYCNDGIIVVKGDDSFIIHKIRGQPQHFPDVKFKDPFLKVDKVILQNNYLIYSQEKCIVGLKLDPRLPQEVPKEEFVIMFDENNEISPTSRELTLIMSGNHLIYLNPYSPTKIFIYNLKTNSIEKELILDKVIRERLPCHCGAIKMANKKLFIAISTNQSHSIYEYDLTTWEWGVKLNTPSFVTKLYVSEGMLCALVRDNNSEDSLFVWSLSDYCLLTEMAINGKQPIFINNGVLFHCQNSIVITNSLKNNIDSKFYVKADFIIGLYPVGKHLLVINTGNGIEIWDWGTGEKLYSPYKGITATQMWVDDQMILVNRWCCNFNIVGFW